ncbi:hypothetical protein AB0D67_30535 [Streptosporangium sp. NPDC048047]|uniref:hypothetical protein n=1 Tax=Streptosporangium sp. NPDC048047 TaxID=3155748 RepID=UPI003423B6A3
MADGSRPRTTRVAACRPRPVTEAPLLIPDAMAAHLDDLLTDTGVIEVIETEFAHRPGPPGMPVRTVLLGLLLAVYYTGSAQLADAWRLTAFSLSPATRRRHQIPDIDPDDRHAQHALSRRFYRTFDKITTGLDVVRVDRRRRLTAAEADAYTSAWDDDEPEHQRKRDLLQDIVTRLVLTPVRRARGRGYLAHYGGDVGIDATAIPTWARPPRLRRSTGQPVASIEITAGWHHSAGDGPPTFGYSATLATAARTRDTLGTHPQLALGLVLDTPHRRVGPAAITALDAIASLGLPTGTLAVDRAYTDQSADHFARPARRRGYRLALDYRVEQRGLQGSVHGALLVDGNLACPLMPDPLLHATTGLDDAAVRAPDDELTALIHARRPYLLKVKQTSDAEGRLRLQCPAAGTAPSVNCPRFAQARAAARGPRTRIDLTDARQRAAHAAAKPTALLPQTGSDDGCLPTICTQQTITLRPGDLGHKDKLRQDLPYLSPVWKGAFKAIRANTEGINGRLKGQVINLADPTNRLAHGRVAQTILVALMVCVANQKILLSWRQVHNPEPRPSSLTGDGLPAEPGIDDTTGNSGRPPPDRP